VIGEGESMEHQAEDQHVEAAPEPRRGTGHEIRPVDNLKVCAACLVSNSAADTFCTACGAPLHVISDAGADTSAGVSPAATEIRDQWSAPLERTTVQPGVHPPVPAAAFAAVPAATQRRRWPLVGALLVGIAGAAAFAMLWQVQTTHAHRLSRALGTTRTSLASTRSTLHQTQAKLSSAKALSEKRREVLLQAKNVLAKVEPLLSSVDAVQNKADTVGDQGSTLSGDAETFIGTVAGLVNYMIDNDASYYDWSWINQQIDDANSQLGTIRYDENVLSADSSAYGSASDKFAVKASAFTQSVRTLEKQLNQVSGG
jgi:hypothetical protein